MKNVLSLLLLMVFSLSIYAQNEEFGLASFYSDKFDGGKTAYGDTYDKNEMTAAHKKHPYGTELRITRLDNKRSVTVKVIDKGPYIKGRVVDLSRRAAERLGLSEDGVAEVKVEVVREGSDRLADNNRTRERVVPESFNDENTGRIATTESRERAEARDRAAEAAAKAKADAAKEAEDKETEMAVNKKPTATSKARLVGQDYTQYGLYKIVLERPASRGFGVQVASLSNYENVLKQVADLQAKWFDNILISVEKGGQKPIYKIILGPFNDEKSAQNYESSLMKKFKIKGFTVNLNEIKY